LVGTREEMFRSVAAGTDRTVPQPRQHNRVVWIAPFDQAHMLGLFWNVERDEFVGYYVNLQEPLRKSSAMCFDSFDHTLDIVIAPDSSWRWKDSDELDFAVELGLHNATEARQIRAEGER